MRANPTMSSTTGTADYKFYRNNANDPFNSLTLSYASPESIEYYNQDDISGTAGHAGFIRVVGASASVALVAEI